MFIFCYFSEDLTKNAKWNTTVISDVLNKLVDPKTYDKRLRPKYGREPVDVGITIHVSSISAVSEVDMVSAYASALFASVVRGPLASLTKELRRRARNALVGNPSCPR